MNDRTHDTPPDLDVEPGPRNLVPLRSPQTPTTISELSTLKGEAVEIIQARVQVVVTLRAASIGLTSPADWLLFKSPEEQGGQVTGYCQDSGAERFRDLWGIEIFGISEPKKITGVDPGVFSYTMYGSGRCRITGQILEQVIGARHSTDDFCKGKTGVDLEVSVMKAARANLDGNITRELAGMKSVSLDELEAAWKGTAKKIADCRRGRGFGSHDERVGGRSSKGPDVDPPICPHCGATGVYRPGKGDRGAFYGCPKYQDHPAKKFIVNAAEWEAGAAARAAQGAPAAASTSSGPAPTAAAQGGDARRSSAPPAGRVSHELGADQIQGFGGRRREPGEEG